MSLFDHTTVLCGHMFALFNNPAEVRLESDLTDESSKGEATEPDSAQQAPQCVPAGPSQSLYFWYVCYLRLQEG